MVITLRVGQMVRRSMPTMLTFGIHGGHSAYPGNSAARPWLCFNCFGVTVVEQQPSPNLMPTAISFLDSFLV